LATALTAVPNAHTVVFLSPNAVAYGLNALESNGVALPSGIEVVAIGPGTAARLAQSGVVTTAIPKDQFDSEGLLQLKQFALPTGKLILIFGGEGGREWLANQLRKAGAQVVQIECYRRSLPEATGGKVIARWRERGIDVVTLTSVLAADNLVTLLGSYADTLLRRAIIVTISQRIVDHCSAWWGWQGPFQVARHAGDNALLQAIHECWLSRSTSSGCR
jgi:uroporphyrinogen-III synthase